MPICFRGPVFKHSVDSYFCLPHQKHEITPTKTVKTENGPISRRSQSEMSMVRDLWRKRFTKKVSFELRVKEWMGDGWGKWRREGWIEVSIKRWNWFTKLKWKFIPEMRRGILKRAVCDLKGRGGKWTSKCDNIRGASIIVSLKRDEIM